jgi:hypothetical protein
MLSTIIHMSLIFSSCGLAGVESDKAAILTSDQIIDAWQSRRKRIATFRAKWEERQSTSRPSRVTEVGSPAEGSQPQELTLVSKYSLIIKESKFCFEQSGNVPTAKADGAVFTSVRDTKTCYDGKQTKGLTHFEEFPQGAIDSQRASLGRQVVLLPIMIAFYLVDSDFAPFSSYQLTIVDKTAFVGDSSCIVARIVDKKSPHIVRDLYCDPKKQFSVLRYLMQANGKPVCQIDMDWTQNPKGEWAPRSWQASTFNGDGTLKTATEATITDIVFNDLIDDEKEFDVQFPIGTRVDDRTANRVYIVQEDEQRRDILPAEVASGMSQEEFLSTRSGERLERKSSRIWMLCGTVAIIIVLTWLVLNKRVQK